jgi:hypothetical protein
MQFALKSVSLQAHTESQRLWLSAQLLKVVAREWGVGEGTSCQRVGGQALRRFTQTSYKKGWKSVSDL